MGIKEPFNSISHMVGGVLSLALLPIMVHRASGTLAVAAAVIYGGTLVAMYTLSVLYHSIPHERAEPWLFRLDQVGIYLLIAGTYTPVSLLVVGGTAGWVLFGVEWVLAAVGTALLLAVPRAPQVLHQVAYIALGWAAVVVLPILLALPMSGLALLVVGGILYTAGSYLYNRDRRGTIGRLGDHELWHLLVLGGSTAHAVFVVFFAL